MRLIHFALAVLSLAVAVQTSVASGANPVAGTDYRILDKTQSVENGKKIEVTEFFWYSCPHCNAFDPSLAEWVKSKGDSIIFKRVPVAFRPSEEPMQKLYYALEAMGKTEELHKKIFHAIHVERKPLNEENLIADFVASQGVDRAKFLNAYNSFGVQTKVRRAGQLLEIFKVDGVPLVAIDGRFETAPSMLSASMENAPEPELFSATLKVMDWLVAKAVKEHKS